MSVRQMGQPRPLAEMHLSGFIPAFIDILPQLNTPNRIQETQYPFDSSAEV